MENSDSYKKILSKTKIIFGGVVLSGLLLWCIFFFTNQFSIPSWFIIGLPVFVALTVILSFLNDTIIITAIFFTLAYPYRLTISIGPLNSFSITEITLALFLSVLLWRFALRRTILGQKSCDLQQHFRVEVLDLAIFLYLSFNLLSFFWAYQFDLALRGIIPILENVFLYYLIVYFARNWPRTRYVSLLFLGLGVFAVILSAIFFFGRLDFLDIIPPQDAISLASVRARLGSPAWGRSNYFATAMLLFLPAYLAFAMLSKSLKKRLLFCAIIIGSFVVFLFTWSRGGYIGLAGGIIALLAVSLKKRKFSICSIVVIAIIVILLAGVIVPMVLHFSHINTLDSVGYNRIFKVDDSNIKIRLYTWRKIWNYVQSNVLGVGIGNAQTVGQNIIQNVHNAYLQVLLETGSVGLAIFILLLALMLRKNWQLIRKMENNAYSPLALGLFASFVAILINIGGEASFEGVVFGWLFWITQGLVRAFSLQTASPTK